MRVSVYFCAVNLANITRNMSWFFLIIGGFFEVGFTFSLGKAQSTEGAISAWWYMSFGICLIASMLLLMKAAQVLPLGTAYAVWTGIGAVGTVLVGILIFKEPATALRLFFITTLIGSIIGLKVVSPH